MLIRNAILPDGRARDIQIDGERIVAIEEEIPDDDTVIDAMGKRVMPGMIDVHVHFRDPGDTHKETWRTGSRSAAAGGVTTVVDQPNTNPPTIDGPSFDQKAERAAESLIDYGINGGVLDGWHPEELLDRPVFALGEVFMAESTGDMKIDERGFREALEIAGANDITVTVHAEDPSRFNPSARERDDPDAWSAYRSSRAEIAAVKRVCDIASEYDVDLHIVHASTPESIDAAGRARVSCEVTPHHMFLSRSFIDDLGTHGIMNPPLRREKRRQRVYDRVRDGHVDIIATDHAPHTRSEKDASVWEAPSGVPGVETALPLLLEEVRREHLTYERVRDLTAANPAALFGLPRKGRIAPGYDADLVLFDPEATTEIHADRLHTKCDWTSFEGWDAVFPEMTVVRGTVVYEDTDGGGRFSEHQGRNVRLPRYPDEDTKIDEERHSEDVASAPAEDPGAVAGHQNDDQ